MSGDTSPIERMVEGFSTGNLEAVLGVFADDILYEDVPFGVVARGKEEVAGFCREFMASLPDFKQELTSCQRAGMRRSWSG